MASHVEDSGAAAPTTAGSIVSHSDRSDSPSQDTPISGGGKMSQTPSPSTPASHNANSASKRPPRKSTLTQQQKNQKRQRATQDQLTTLEMEFNKNPTPTATVREKIADEINMTERSVQIWFQNRYEIDMNLPLTRLRQQVMLTRTTDAPRLSCWRRRVWKPARTLTPFPSPCATT